MPLTNPTSSFVGCVPLSQRTEQLLALTPEITRTVGVDCPVTAPFAPARVTNNQCRNNAIPARDGVYLGTSGNVNGPVGSPLYQPWAVDTFSNVIGTATLELGLRVTGRPTDSFLDASVGGAVVMRPGQGMKIDYSVRLLNPGLDTLNSLALAGGLFEFGFDIDDSAATNFQVFDPVTFPYRTPSGDGFMQLDHAFLSPTAGHATINQDPNPSVYTTLMTTSTGIQNSVQPRFLGPTLTSFLTLPCTVATLGAAPCAAPPGRYEVFLRYLDSSNVERARVQFSVFQAFASLPPGETPSSLLMACDAGNE